MMSASFARNTLIRVLLAWVLVFPTPAVQAGEVTTLTAVEDASLDEANPTANDGTSSSLKTPSLSGGDFRSLVRFSLSSLPSDTSIKTSFLKMKLTTAPASSRNQTVHRVTGSTAWTEGGVNWNSRNGSTNWTSPGGDYDATAADTRASGTTGGATLNWTILGDGGVANIPQGWLDGSVDNRGLLVKDQTEDGTGGGGGGGAVTFDVASSKDGGTTNYMTWSHTVTSAGSDRILIVGVSSDNGVAVNSVYYGGVQMSAVPNSMAQLDVRVELYYLTNPATGPNTVEVNLASSTACTGGATSFTGVNQSTPLGTAKAVSGHSSTASVTGVASATGEVVVDHAGVESTSATMNADGSQAERYKVQTSTTVRAGGSTKDGAASVTMTWNISATKDWAITAVSLKPAAAAPGPQWGSRENTGNEPQLEVHHLRNVSLGAFTVGCSDITLNWTFPAGSTSSNYEGALFAKKQGGASPTFSPTDGTGYSVGQEPLSGESVVGNTSSFSTVSLVDENGPDSVLVPGTQYSYKAFTRDNNTITGAAQPSPPHYATGTSQSVTTASGASCSDTNKNWSYKTGASTLAAPGLVGNGTIVLAGNDNKIHAMDDTTGARRYRPAGSVGTTGGAIQSRPPVIPAAFSSVDCDTVTPGLQTCDVVYVGAGDGKVYAFNASTGAKLWESAVLGSNIQGAPAVQVRNFSNAAFQSRYGFDLVIAGTRNSGDATNNKVIALDASSGCKVWEYAPGNLDIITSQPMIDYSRNEVWVTSYSNANTQPSIRRLDTLASGSCASPGGGSAVASITIPGESDKDIEGSPTLNSNNSFLFFVSRGGFLVVVDTSDNSINGTGIGGIGVGFPIPVLEGSNTDHVYFTTTTGVYMRIFNRSTKIFSMGWDNTSIANPSAPMFVPPPGTLGIYVGSSDGKLHRLNASGTVEARRTLNASATIGDPSFDPLTNKVYAGASDGRIYAFDLFTTGGGGGASPQVAATNTSATTTASTSHTLQLPTGIQSGDLLIALLSGYIGSGSTPVDVNWPLGWTEFFEEDASTSTLHLAVAGAYRKADGTEGASITVSTNVSVQAAHNSYRITGAADPATQPPQAATIPYTDTATGIDPPSLSPTGGVKNYLWLAVAGWRRTGRNATVNPTNYTDVIEGNSAGGASGTKLRSLRRQLSATSEDPSTFTLDSTSERRIGVTIAVHPLP